jgi:diguanylate cyclase (GGDEF)-like protein
MRERLTRLYVALTCGGAIATVAAGCWLPARTVEWTWWGAALVFAAVVTAELLAVPLPKAGYVSVATIAHIAGALWLPPAEAAIASGAAMLAVQLRERARPSRLVFNTGCTTMTVGLAALLANHAGLSGQALGAGDWTEILLFFALACVTYVVNALLVASVVAVSSGDRLWAVLRANSRYSAPVELAAAMIGGVIALVWVRAPNWLPAAFFPAIVAQLTLQYIAASARKAAELEHQALHDQLTDLPNRVLLRERLRQAIAAARRDGHPLALLVLDLDRFKEVNDTLGHHYGDLLLREVGSRLQGVLRAGDTLARLGGDEFAIVLPMAGAQTAHAFTATIVQALTQPFVLDGHRFDIGASIGIALVPEHGVEADVLLRRADVAMYIAKRTGSGHALYTPEQDPNSPARLGLISDLRRAIEAGELALCFQPKVDLRSGRLTGVEALARWPHPERGAIPPDQFIPLAEQTGLIRPLSRWVLDAALGQWRVWHTAGLELPIAVNLSMRDLHDPDLPAAIAALLVARGVAPAWLRVEITESSLMADPERALAVVTRLRALGVRISIDDFGTGYSSLAYLKRLPVDELKIDRSFVRHLTTDENDRAIVRSTIGLAHELGLDVVTEGVEDQATWELLTVLGCDSAQGYFVSHPLSGADLAGWLADWSRRSACLAGAGPLVRQTTAA